VTDLISKNLLQKLEARDLEDLGRQLHQFASELYPICRSITGDGMRQTLAQIQKRIPLETFEVPTGAQVFDWTVPKEWNIRDAYIKDAAGQRVIDFKKHNLHVMNYSLPVRAKMQLRDLKPHLHTLPDHPDWIPYRTSYYQEQWGFCLSHREMLAMPEGEYEVSIDSTLAPGHLTYAECFLPGKTSEEVLISCHACHPSLANDNISGIVVATFLAELLSQVDRKYSYRSIFIPGTIGAITWLARNQKNTKRIRHGLVLTGIGDRGGFHYKKSRRGDAEIDLAMAHVLRHAGEPAEVLEFSPYGYDERQYCSPGFNLPVGCLMRSVWGTFPEYHTSADNLDFIDPLQLARSLRICARAFDVLENNQSLRNLNPYCEPQLGKRNLYRSTGGSKISDEINARLWVLNLSDGEHSLLEIAGRSGLAFASIREAAALLSESGLLAPAAKAKGEAAADSGSRKPKRSSQTKRKGSDRQ
jgi:aminopeptidase-like protein